MITPLVKKIRNIKKPAPEHIRDFIRNIVGRYHLFLVLVKWDRIYRREVMVTVLAFALINYSILDMDSPYDYLALFIEAVILWIQLGNEFSILPKEYRPNYNGVSFSTRATTYITHGNETVPFEDILPPKSEDALKMYNPIKGKGLSTETPLCSDKLNDYLMGAEHMPYKVEDSTANYISSVHQIRYLAIRVANKKQHTTNAEKLCLDASAAGLIGDAPIPVRKTAYFDGLLTAEAFRSRIYCKNLRGIDEVNTDLTQYYPVEEVIVKGKTRLRLVPEYYKLVSGHIGATSLLFSENRRVIMLFQGQGKAVDANKVSLGGSGSMDFKDVQKSSNEDLRAAIRRCMARETVEETGMESYYTQALENTMLTGFFHWMDRSGKPEFTGITKAGTIPFAARNAIDGDEIVRSEEIPVTIDKLADFAKVLEYLKNHNINTSLSSLMGLQRMIVIAGYGSLKASRQQKRIYKQVNTFLFA